MDQHRAAPRGGRSQAVAGSTSRPLEHYFGATGGGLWKTTDGGQTWAPVTDGQLNSSSVGAVAVCEANEAVMLIPDIKTQIDDRIEASEDVELRSFGTYMKNRLGRIEEEVYQVRNRSSQDPLNFPIKLNNKLG